MCLLSSREQKEGSHSFSSSSATARALSWPTVHLGFSAGSGAGQQGLEPPDLDTLLQQQLPEFPQCNVFWAKRTIRGRGLLSSVPVRMLLSPYPRGGHGCVPVWRGLCPLISNSNLD